MSDRIEADNKMDHDDWIGRNERNAWSLPMSFRVRVKHVGYVTSFTRAVA